MRSVVQNALEDVRLIRIENMWTQEKRAKLAAVLLREQHGFLGFFGCNYTLKKNDQGTFHISYHRTPHAGSTAWICWKVYSQNTPNVDEQMFWHDDNRNLLPVFLKSGSPETLGL